MLVEVAWSVKRGRVARVPGRRVLPYVRVP